MVSTAPHFSEVIPMNNFKNNAVCSICGKEYYVCKSCKDMISFHPYKLHTDTSEHYKIYQIIHGYNTNVYSIEEAKEKLQTVDLSDLNTFRENIKTIIKTILNYNTNDAVDIKVDNTNSVTKKTTRRKTKTKVGTDK